MHTPFLETPRTAEPASPGPWARRWQPRGETPGPSAGGLGALTPRALRGPACTLCQGTGGQSSLAGETWKLTLPHVPTLRAGEKGRPVRGSLLLRPRPPACSAPGALSFASPINRDLGDFPEPWAPLCEGVRRPIPRVTAEGDAWEDTTPSGAGSQLPRTQQALGRPQLRREETPSKGGPPAEGACIGPSSELLTARLPDHLLASLHQPTSRGQTRVQLPPSASGVWGWEEEVGWWTPFRGSQDP